MPNVSYVITNRLKQGWQRYWERRPNDVPLDLYETLTASQVATSEQLSRFRPTQYPLWLHPSMPGSAFVAKPTADGETVEHVILCMVGEDTAAQMPKFPPIPAGLTGEQEADELTRRTLVLTEWLHQQPKSNPYRGHVGLELVRLSVSRRAANQRRDAEWRAQSAARLADEHDESDQLVTNENGKIMTVPPIRWLLREVKELKRRVAELEGRE